MRAAGRRVQSVQGVAGSIHFRGFEQPRLWATLFVSLRDSFTPSLPHIQVSTCTHTLRVTHRRITATCWRLMVDDLRCGSLAAAPLPLCGTMPCVFERARCMLEHSVTSSSKRSWPPAWLSVSTTASLVQLSLQVNYLVLFLTWWIKPGQKKKNDSVCSESESEWV